MTVLFLVQNTILCIMHGCMVIFQSFLLPQGSSSSNKPYDFTPPMIICYICSSCISIVYLLHFFRIIYTGYSNLIFILLVLITLFWFPIMNALISLFQYHLCRDFHGEISNFLGLGRILSTRKHRCICSFREVFVADFGSK